MLIRFFVAFLFSFLFSGTTYAYVFWVKSFDNTIRNIEMIEQRYDLHFPMVWLIFDTRNEREQQKITDLAQKLWRSRIYHLSFSPEHYSAWEVAEGLYDHEYRSFFAIIKEYDLKVVFRTMHEMNSGWFPWSDDTDSFKRAWKHIHRISREVGLDQKNILFTMSSNHRDMPAEYGKPSQQAPLVECTIEHKKQTNCSTFENYYPGDEYVDLVGVTFYNRWKWNSDRKWLMPDSILNDPDWETLTRLKSLGKPLFIDEVATTAIWYEGMYDQQKSQEMYTRAKDKKNEWLSALAQFIAEEEAFLGMLYFNTDYTDGLAGWHVGEADWAAINLNQGKLYTWIYDLFEHSKRNSHRKLAALFHHKILWKGQKAIMIRNDDYALFLRLRNILEIKVKKKKLILAVLEQIQGKLYKKETHTPNDKKLQRVIFSLYELYE